jgi:hypothetical protein
LFDYTRSLLTRQPVSISDVLGERRALETLLKDVSKVAAGKIVRSELVIEKVDSGSLIEPVFKQLFSGQFALTEPPCCLPWLCR